MFKPDDIVKTKYGGYWVYGRVTVASKDKSKVLWNKEGWTIYLWPNEKLELVTDPVELEEHGYGRSQL